MRQYAGFGTAAESNRRYRYLLEHGTTGLSVAFDLPTQIGYDSDDPHAVGRGGPGRGRHRQPGGHGDAARRPPPRTHLHVDDDQRHRGHPARPLRRGGAASRHPGGGALRDRAERHPQGVRGARDLHLSSRAVAPSRHRPHRLLRRRRAHAGTPSRSPATTSARRGRRRPRRSRSPSPTPSSTCARHRRRGSIPTASGSACQLLLRLPFRLHRGGREVPGGAAAVGASHEGALRRRRTPRPSSSASTCRRAG